MVRFTLKAPRALLGFRTEMGEGPVKVALELNGRPVPASAISLGRNRTHPEDSPFVVPESEGDRLLPTEFVERELRRSGKLMGGVH